MQAQSLSESSGIKKINVVSRQLLCWTVPFLCQEFSEINIYQAPSIYKSKYLGDKIEKAWKTEAQRKDQKSFLRVILKLFGVECFAAGCLFALFELVINMCLLFLISKVITCYQDQATSNVYIYAGFLVISLVFATFVFHAGMVRMEYLGVKMRLACSSLIYRKSLRLSTSYDLDVGQMVNFLSNDLNRFESLLVHCNHVWVAPLQIVLGTYLLYSHLGPSSIAGIFLLCLNIPLQCKEWKMVYDPSIERSSSSIQ